MNRTLIKDLKDHVNKEVFLQGWVQEVRNLNKIAFIIIRDRSGDMQTLALKSSGEEVFSIIKELTKESVIELTGSVQENKESRWGLEVLIKAMKVLSVAQTPLPIDNTDKSNTSIDKRLDHRFLDTRNKKVAAIFKVRSKIVKILTNFYTKNGFTNINTPKMTVLGLESGAELFTVDYFGKSVYLAQSPQLYKQMFVAGGFERVFEIGSVFRAEKSHTTRHLTEFVGADLEMAFINDYHDVMNMIELVFKDLITNVNKEAKEELELLNVTIKVPQSIPRITIFDAKKMLAEKGKKLSVEDDLDSEAEKILGELVKEQYGEDFVFITDYPWAVRPFYHMKHDGNSHVTCSFDLLFRGVEICTGAQREHRLDILEKQAKEKNIDLDPIYAEIFKFGCPPHGGGGLGLDRITHRLLDLDNVREAVLLPRDPERIKP